MLKLAKKVWEGVKSAAVAAKDKTLAVLGLSAGSALVVQSGDAAAAVPTGVEALFTGTATDFGTIIGYGYTLMLAVVGGLVLIKLVKKVFFKST